jgi:hypothetical protein
MFVVLPLFVALGFVVYSKQLAKIQKHFAECHFHDNFKRDLAAIKI